MEEANWKYNIYRYTKYILYYYIILHYIVLYYILLYIVIIACSDKWNGQARDREGKEWQASLTEVLFKKVMID